MDRIKYEHIRGGRIRILADIVRVTRLRWFGHTKSRDRKYIGRKKREKTKEVKMQKMG